MISKTIGAVFCLSVLLIASILIAAQSTPSSSASAQSAQDAAKTPALKVATRLVLLDVVALDHKGQPVTDLKSEDFSIEEEGSHQQIRIFNLQQPGQQSVTAAAPKLAPNMFSNVPTFSSDKTLSVLLLDSLNTDYTKQKYIREEMLHFLEKLPAGQPVAVYALGAKLRLLQDFTTDPSLLKQAIANTKGHPTRLADAAANGQAAPYLDAATNAAMQEMGLAMMQAQIQLFQQEDLAFQTDQRVLLTMTALKSLARALSGYPGRKNLIWVSSAFPSMIFGSTSVSRGSPFDPVLSNYRDDLERISNALSDARVAVYPVDASAVVNNGIYSNLSNEDSNGNSVGRTSSNIGAMGAEMNRGSDERLGVHSTMNEVAEGTGGKAFYNRNDLADEVHEGMNDGLVYYTMGYYPENKVWDGKFRHVVVKVNRGGLKLRYRVGYFAIDPKAYSKLDSKQQAIDFGEALSLDYPVSTAMTFRAVAIPPSDKSGNKLVINFGIDPHTIGFDLGDDGLEHASIDCAAQAFTLKGASVQVRGNTFNAALKPDAYQMVMQRFFPCNQPLDLSPGDYVLRLGVRDNSSGHIGTANARVTVPASSVASTTDAKKP